MRGRLLSTPRGAIGYKYELFRIQSEDFSLPRPNLGIWIRLLPLSREEVLNWGRIPFLFLLRGRPVSKGILTLVCRSLQVRRLRELHDVRRR